MTKQLSPLEALERIKNTQVKNATSPFDYVYIKDERKHELDIIETALKALEIITKNLDFDVELGSLPNGIPTYKLDVWCKGTPTVVKPIKKEEFDLLKEVKDYA